MGTLKHKKNKRRIKAQSLLNQNDSNDNINSGFESSQHYMHGSSKAAIRQGVDPEELDIIDKGLPLIKPKLKAEVSPTKLLPSNNLKRRLNFIKSQKNR